MDYEPNVTDGLSFYKEGYHREKITSDFNRAITEGIDYDCEYIIITAQGQEKWVRAVGVPVFIDGKCSRVHGVFQDIDKQKRADILLKENESRFKQIFENAPNGIALISANGDWIKVNAQFLKILGYTENELLTLNFKKLTHPDDLDNELENLNRLLKGEADNYQTEKKYLHKKGHSVWCIHSVTLKRTSDNSPNYFIAQIIDISSLKTAHNKIQTLLEETSKKNEKLLNFKHIVSHNLRSHTSNLEMLLGFLKEDIPTLNETPIFDMVKDAFSNLKETIKNLSEISGFETKSASDYVRVSIEEEMNRSLKNIYALVSEVGGSIEMEIDSNIEAVVIPEYLQSAFLNILTNAIKYRQENKMLHIKIVARSTESGIVISFTDNGLGIDLDLHGDKVFGMYKTFHRKENARGLGLYIVKNQIEAMGGQITVKSKVHVGSTFQILLKK